MAGKAAADDVGMIDADHREPVAGAVTVFAQVIGLDVLDALASGDRAIVAAGTTGSSVAVIKTGIQPAVGTVAVFTIVSAGNMVL